MVKPWIRKSLEVLRVRFGQESFSYQDAFDSLWMAGKRKPTQVKVVLSELRRSGDLIREPDSRDARTKVYRVKPISGLLAGGTSPATLTPQEWESLWFKIIDLVRFRRDFTCLPLLFYLKIVCERTKVQWVPLKKDSTNFKEAFRRIFNTALEANPQVQDVFDFKEFGRFVKRSENRELVAQFVDLLRAISLLRVDPHVLRQAYEQLLLQTAFPNQRGFYSIPQEIPQLLVKILDPQVGDSVFDAWMGLGSILIACYLYTQRAEVGKEMTSPLSLFGRESLPRILPLARRNLMFNGLEKTQLNTGDAKAGQKFRKGKDNKSFDLVISCPHFHFGLPHKASSDWKVIRNVLPFTRKRVGLVLESGCLNRRGREKDIRADLVKGDQIESVIQLPKNLNSEARIPLTILVFNKAKSPERKNHILFIDATQEFDTRSETSQFNRIVEKQFEKVLKAYREYQTLEGFSRIVSIKEIEGNEYNLSVSLYVGSSKKGENVDAHQLWKALKAQDIAIQKEMGEIENALKKLGYK